MQIKNLPKNNRYLFFMVVDLISFVMLFAMNIMLIMRNVFIVINALDEDDNVILVGNPLRNKKIEEMFYKIVEERLGKS